MNRTTENILFVGGGLIIGFVIGGVITNERLKKVYSAQAEEDIRSVKKHYMVLYKGGEYSTPEKAIKSYKKKVADLGYVNDPSETVEGRNDETGEEKEDTPTFDPTSDEEVDEVDDDEDLIEDEEPEELPEDEAAIEAESQRQLIAQRLEDEKPGGPRDPARPFVISIEEFMESDPPYGKCSITYFAEDNVLMDEREDVMVIDETVGEDCLGQFGSMSQDPNTVYVRNDRLGADYEIVLDERAYSEVVIGIRRPKARTRPPKYKEVD